MWITLLSFLINPRTIVYGGIGLVALFAYGWGSQVINSYSSFAANNALLQRQLTLQQSREKSLRTLLERRNQAIAASKCKDQIERWVKDPDSIPKPFDPFNQLN